MSTFLYEKHFTYITRTYFVLECERWSFTRRMFVEGWDKKIIKAAMRNGIIGFEITVGKYEEVKGE